MSIILDKRLTIKIMDKQTDNLTNADVFDILLFTGTLILT